MESNGNERLVQSLIDDGYLKNSLLIEAFRAIDRADFTPAEYQHEAYANYPLPIGRGQTISQPLTVAFMLELLDPQPGERILDIGSGSGWTSALLARVVGKKETGRVFSIERVPELCEFGKKNIEKYKYISEGVVEYFCQDGTLGLPQYAPFDKILASAAASKKIPEAWKTQLAIGGKIVAPAGNSVWLFIKKGETEWEEQEFPGFIFVPLIKDRNQTVEHPVSHKHLLRWAGIISIAVILLATNEIFLPHASYEGLKTIEISPGMGSRTIGELLKQEGIIRSKWAFVTYIAILGNSSSLKPGIYKWGARPISAIAGDLVRGQTNEQTIIIPEGWSNMDIAEYFERKGIAAKEEFLILFRAKPSTVQEKFDFLKDKPAHAGFEGYLFPDTYRVFIGSGPEEVIRKMLENFDRKLAPDLRTEIARQKKSIFEIITMASLIEKEVASDEDRALVSGVLWKRLEHDIALQVDATITYIKNQESRIKNQENRKVTIKDTQIDSPYNTYKYPGLPKGPIANPGMSAIRAAISPKESPYLYYLSTPEGKTIFSKTLEEHNEAKARYLP